MLPAFIIGFTYPYIFTDYFFYSHGFASENPVENCKNYVDLLYHKCIKEVPDPIKVEKLCENNFSNLSGNQLPVEDGRHYVRQDPKLNSISAKGTAIGLSVWTGALILTVAFFVISVQRN